MKSDEIRENFLKFFESKEHLRWPSASIVPLGDPTLLLMTAGMAPFKPYFSGTATPPSKRMTTCQKCVRADDVDRVGKTVRHHTFFEMLGNFSFGDYFKKETAQWAWEYFTEVLKLDKNKLYITIHTDDDEAFKIWREIGIPADRITRLPDNFWGPVGDSGPCGPCSEICYDLGKELGCGKDDCKPGCDCDRYLEVWNLVFTGLNKTKDGKFENLPAPCIDTGMGLERLAMVLQNKPTPFHTDLFQNLIKEIEKISGKKFDKDPDVDLAVKVVADHIRAAVFMISDGITPGNQGRGYVLRRFLRRAATMGQMYLNIRTGFLNKLVDSVVEINKKVYPELLDKKELIKNLILQEEETFRKTLNNGLEIINNQIEVFKKENKDTLGGDMVFKLYDTYGFPPELTLEIAAEHKFKADMDEYNKLLDSQRERGRRDLDEKLKDKTLDNVKLDVSFVQEFIGAKAFSSEAVLEDFYIISDTEADLFINPTPFYAESGGQIHDTGIIECEDFKFRVQKVLKHESGAFIHKGTVTRGNINKKDIMVNALIDIERRLDIMRNHTATHLLHSALRQVLGKHVSQTGSFVGDAGLRFDFSHGKHLSEEELREVEQIVNNKILENIKIDKELKDLDEAIKSGATALFQEKYDQKVNVVKIGGFSAELCGGTHIDYTGQIGFFKILKETSVGTGIRRIEAITGRLSLKTVQNMYREFELIKGKLNLTEEEVAGKVFALYEENLSRMKEIESLKNKEVLGQSDDFIKDAETINGVNVIRKFVKGVPVENLRQLSDKLKAQLKSGIVILVTDFNDKGAVLTSVTEDLVKNGCHAGKIAGKLAEFAGGKGGGRPDFAQAGAKDASKLQEALDRVNEIIGNGE